MLDEKRIAKISKSIETVIELTDPVGEIIFGYNLPNGLILKNIRVPFGVIGIIYEARPNVTVDAVSFMSQSRQLRYTAGQLSCPVHQSGNSRNNEESP